MEKRYIDIREEMELIKERQQELIVEQRYGNDREIWKLQIVWEYFKEKLRSIKECFILIKPNTNYNFFLMTKLINNMEKLF